MLVCNDLNQAADAAILCLHGMGATWTMLIVHRAYRRPFNDLLDGSLSASTLILFMRPLEPESLIRLRASRTPRSD